jgi:flavin-dependent dehydrogenase
MLDGLTYDVAVVGGSIAGCTTAILFAKRGLRVGLLESNPDPSAYKKICTHFIQPSATPTIQRLAVAEAIEAAGGLRNGIWVWTRWGWIRPGAADASAAPYGYNVRRQVLDPLLRDRAARTAGVDVLLGFTARELVKEDGRFAGVVATTQEGALHSVRARLVVAADGRHSRLAKLSGVRQKTKPNNRFCYFAHYRNVPLASGACSQIWLLEPDVAYTFPNDDGITVLACFVTKDKLAQFKSDLTGSFERLFANLPLGPDLSRAERVSEIMGMLDMPNVSRHLTLSNLAFVGDAAMASDPLWGVGCGWAFQSAEWLVDATADALARNGDLARALSRFRRRHRRWLGPHHFLIADYATGRRLNPLERVLFSAAARDQGMARHFNAFGARMISVPAFLSPVAIGRALAVNVTWRGRKTASTSAPRAGSSA